MSTAQVYLFSFLAVGVFLLAVRLMYLLGPTVLVCGVLGWHNGNGRIIDPRGGVSARWCDRCGKEVLLDSQGNWF